MYFPENVKIWGIKKEQRFMSGIPVFVGCHPGNTPWPPCSGGQHSLYSWVPWQCNNQRYHSWQANTMRAMYGQQTEASPPSFFCGDLFACPGFWLKGKASRLHISRGYRGACLECGSGDAISVLFLPCSCSLVFPRNKHAFPWLPDFCDCHLGETSRLPGSGGQ